MQKIVTSLLALFVANTSLHAASQQVIWGQSKQALPPISQPAPVVSKRIVINTTQQTLQKQSLYQLQALRPSLKNAKHARYQLTFRGVPVFGYQLVVHKKPGNDSFVTGVNVTGIEEDVQSIDGQLTAVDVEKKVLADISGGVRFKQIKKVIFIDIQQKAHLAYHFSFYTHNQNKPYHAFNYMIDANSGDVLKQWDNVRHEKIGQGMGGNAFKLPFRAGAFQYGDALPGLPSFGKFDVQLKDGRCSVENQDVRVMNLENAILGEDSFPISVANEAEQNLQPFSYACDESSQFLNYADGSSGPVNYAFSPVNDTMFFAQQTIDMYMTLYGVKQPLGTDLPLRAFTHLGGMDNAFAIPTITREDGSILAHQQIVIGNGEAFLTAPSQSVIGHELSHNFTDLNSALIYEGQSGGINEAFSDMAEVALEDYLRTSYPWYWDGTDWSIGREATITGQPLRYMDDPTKDGNSIDNASDYNEDLDVHYSSGVFNKAFYLLANKPGWSIRQAFQVMIDANQHYWQPNSDYDFAACGVIQAAADRGLDKAPVIETFSEVGVSCKEAPNGVSLN